MSIYQSGTIGLYQMTKLSDYQSLTAIPFAFWANRGGGEMRVWIRET